MVGWQFLSEPIWSKQRLASAVRAEFIGLRRVKAEVISWSKDCYSGCLSAVLVASVPRSFKRLPKDSAL